MRTRTHSLHIPIWHRISSKALFFVLASILVVIFMFYAYLVNKTVMNVVSREKNERTIASLSGSIGDMEFKYIGLKNGVTLDLAHSMGFQDATPKAFIGKNVGTLTYNNPSR